MSEALRNFLWILPLVFAANLQEWGFTQIVQSRTQSPKEGDPLASRGRAVCAEPLEIGAHPTAPPLGRMCQLLLRSRQSCVTRMWTCAVRREGPLGVPRGGGGGLDAASICGWDSKCA